MAHEALLIIDMLNDFVLDGAPLQVPDTQKIIPVIKNEIDHARKAGNAIIYVCDTHDPDDIEFSTYGWPAHGVEGTSGAEIVEELEPQGEDIIVNKPDYSSFFRTNLESILKQRDIDKIRLTGCVTHICVLFTAYEAALRGFGVTVVQNGVAGIDKDDHDAALRIMRNVLGVKMV